MSVLVVFGKYFVFTKIVKNSKTMLPCSGDSVASRTSRMPQSRVHTEIFRDSLATHWWVNASIVKKTWNIFQNLVFHAFAAQVGDMFAGGRSSCERYTEIFAAHLATISKVDFPITKNT